jgi:predicted nuclease of restriction endonuclease-like RecB superfamily
MIACGTCLKKFSLAGEGIFPVDSLVFCSEKCLHEHIISMKPLAQNKLKSAGVRKYDSDLLPRGECYSPILRMEFRSLFECSVAEHIEYSWCLPACYEQYGILLDCGNLYIPDFFLPEQGVWLEVKGEWRFGARSKFIEALRKLGYDRLLLIPPSYRGWFKRGKA